MKHRNNNTTTGFYLHWAVHIATLFSIMLLITACGELPQINVKIIDQKTALENQVLGSFEELGQDLTLVESVRSIDEEGKVHEQPEMSDRKKQALLAMQNRAYNQDDIDRFKSLGCVGERNDGFLEILDCKDAKEDPSLLSLIQEIVQEEKQDREVIIHRIIEMNENLTEKDLSKVQQIFALQQIEKAKPGEFIQSENGTWRQK